MKILTFILLFTSIHAMAQKGSTPSPIVDDSPDFGAGLGMDPGLPQMPGPAGRGIPSLSLTTPQNCSFRNENTESDQALLNNVRSLVTALRNDPACTGNGSVTQDQFNAFESTLQNATTYAGIGNTGTLTDERRVTCTTYERRYDMQFEQFVSNGIISSSSIYQECSNLQGQARTDCAVRITSQHKVAQKNRCDSFGLALELQAQDETRMAAYRQGLQIMNQLISNPNCAREDGQLQSNMVSSSVGLLSRVAYSMAPANPLVGLVGNLLSSTITRFFSPNPRTRNTLEALGDGENFLKTACLYEMVEKRANRCEYRRAIPVAQAMLNESNNADAYCRQDNFNSNTTNFLNSISQIASRFRSQPEGGSSDSSAPSDADLDQHIRQLGAALDGATNNGSEESPLDLGLETGREILASFPTPNENNEYSPDDLRRYAEANNIPFSPRQQARVVNALEERKNKIQGALNLMGMIKEQSESQRIDPARVRAAYQAFGSGPQGNVSFMSVFNDIMLTRASTAPDLADRIGAFQTGFATYQRNLETSSNFREYLNNNGLENSNGSIRVRDGINDHNNLDESRLVLKTHLGPLMEREFQRREQELRAITTKPTGRNENANIIAERNQDFTATIKPLLATCSQLRTVNVGSRGDTTEQNRICDMFRCNGTPPSGLTNFRDYLAQNRIQDSSINPERCSGECLAHYKTFICTREVNLNGAEDQFKNEFEQTGTICGQRIAGR